MTAKRSDIQRAKDIQGAIRRDAKRLEQLCVGWVSLQSLPGNPRRDEVLARLPDQERDTVEAIEAIYLKHATGDYDQATLELALEAVDTIVHRRIARIKAVGS